MNYMLQDIVTAQAKIIIYIFKVVIIPENCSNQWFKLRNKNWLPKRSWYIVKSTCPLNLDIACLECPFTNTFYKWCS